MRIADEATGNDERLGAVVAGYKGKDPQDAMDEDFDDGPERVLD